MSDTCDDEVFEFGESLGLFDMSKEEAESLCKEQTTITGRKHDWHYVAGRVHIKAMPEVVMCRVPRHLIADIITTPNITDVVPVAIIDNLRTIAKVD